MNRQYIAEKFSVARRALMLIDSNDMESIGSIFHECSLAISEIGSTKLQGNEDTWVKKLKILMDTTGLNDPNGIGLYQVRAGQLTCEQKDEFASLIDDLADSFKSYEK